VVARDVYLFAVAVVLAVILAAGVADLLLWLTGQETITSFLRQELGLYWATVAFAALFLLALGLHLYIPLPWE